MTDEKPELTLNIGKMWCSYHALPWIETWPGGGVAVSSIELLTAMLERKEIQDEAGAEIESVQPILDRLYPWCCYIAQNDPERMIAVYQKSDTEPPSAHGQG